MNKRNRYTSEFKTKVVLEVLREEQTVNQIAAKYDLAPPMVSRWKAEFLEKAHSVFERETENKEQLKQEFQEKEERLQKLVGQLSVELDWLKKKSGLK
jgi:transposase-like protein